MIIFAGLFEPPLFRDEQPRMAIPRYHLWRDRALIAAYARAADLETVKQHRFTGRFDFISKEMMDFEPEGRWLAIYERKTTSMGNYTMVITEVWFESRSDYAMMRMWGLGE